jgi:translation initiation factor 1A
MGKYRKKKRPSGPIRIRMQRPGEIFGVVEQLLGGARMIVKCEDGKERLTRVPGKIRRFIWVREGDVVLVKPWSIEDEKADVAFRYTRVQVNQMKKKGLLPESIG